MTIFEIGFKENGRQVWRTVEGGISAARARRTAELARIARGEQTSTNPKLSFDQAADAWWEAHRPAVRPKTVAA